jgi:hypothetical protein
VTSFAAPLAWTAHGSPVAAAHAAMVVTGTGTLSLSLDKGWLASQPASAFPITLDPSITLNPTANRSYKNDGTTCTSCDVQFGNAQDGGNAYWRSVTHFDYEQLFGDTVTGSSVHATYVAGSGSANSYSAYVYHASAFSYAGAKSGSVLASGTIGSSGTLSGSGLTSYLQSVVSSRTSNAYFGFVGQETSGLYTYKKVTVTLTINYTTPTAPGAPTSVSATAGNASAVVHFSAPASNGGSAITSYTAPSSPGGKTASGSGNPLTVTGLINGTSYTFTVKATNAVTPATVPGAPTGVSATAGDSQATVSFSAPSSNGGAAITSYTVISSPGGVTGSGAGSPITVTGLTNGTSYTFTVTATNSAGTGPASAASNAVTPAPAASPPGAPKSASATAGDGQATISFTAPSSDGGAPITSYTVTSSPGGVTGSGAGSPITVTGLTNGTSYTFTVTATNSAGTGPASAASNAVTPAGHSAIAWGYDSEGEPITTNDYNAIKNNGDGAGDFFALYMGNTDTSQDYDAGIDFGQTSIDTAHAEGIPIIPIERQFAYESTLGTSKGDSVGQQTVADAKSWNVTAGTAIFIDIEPVPGGGGVDSNFIEAWYKTVEAGGYTPGFYGSDINTFATAYCDAVQDIPAMATNTYLWTFDPVTGEQAKPGPSTFSSNVVTCSGSSTTVSSSRTVLWQYAASVTAGSPGFGSYDENEARGSFPLWYP